MADKVPVKLGGPNSGHVSNLSNLGVAPQKPTICSASWTQMGTAVFGKQILKTKVWYLWQQKEFNVNFQH